MKKITAICIKENEYGEGIILDGKREVTVPNLLKGEQAEVAVFNQGNGKVLTRLSSSENRIKAKCPWYEECGGCQLQHFSYEDQLKIKQESVISAFAKVGLKNVTVLPTFASKNIHHYRNKNQMVVSEKNKKVMTGFYEQNTHNVVNVNECLIQNEQANEIIKSMKNIMRNQKLMAYDENRKTGIVRHFLVRVSESTGEILVVIVTSQEMFPGRNNFVKELRRLHPEITTIIQNINSRNTSVVLGDLERTLYGKGYIEDKMLGKTFYLSSRTFYQVNSTQTEKLYKKAIELAKPKKDDVMVDAYSGVGTIGLLFSDYVSQVIAVESNKESVKSAIQNARINHTKNVRFIHGDAIKSLESFVDTNQKLDILVVDPPRDGLSKEFVEATLQAKPRKIVYISCNPETLARDIKVFHNSGYLYHSVQPVDMFPQTVHVESVALLELK